MPFQRQAALLSLVLCGALLVKPITAVKLSDCSSPVDLETRAWLNGTGSNFATDDDIFPRSSRYENPTPPDATPDIAKNKKSIGCRPDSLLGRPICPKLNFSFPARGHMYYDGDGYFYEPDACVLRRLTFKDARACLARVGPIFFVGDSVTRYQFITLTHFLASGKYQFPFEGEKSLSNAHSFEPDRSSNSFDKLWRHARKQVTKHSPSGTLFVNHERSKAREHAHLELKDGRSGRKLHLFYHYTAVGAPADVQHALEWVLDKGINVSFAILNFCSHYRADAGGRIVRDVVRSTAWAAKRLGSPERVVWRTCTTPQPERRASLDRAEAAIRDHCRSIGVPVYDTRAVAMAGVRQGLLTTWNENTVHFNQFMYEQFNDLLLNILCP